MSSETARKLPLVPKLLLAGLVILLLSWLAFMVHYVRQVANRPSGGDAPPRVLPANPKAPPARP